MPYYCIAVSPLPESCRCGNEYMEMLLRQSAACPGLTAFAKNESMWRDVNVINAVSDGYT